MLSRNLHSAHPLIWGGLTSALAALASYFVPEPHAGSAVGLVFLGAAYALCLQTDSPNSPEHFGLSFGGLLNAGPLKFSRMARDTSRALLLALFVAALILPPFWFGFTQWFSPSSEFSWAKALSSVEGPSGASMLFDLSLAHLLVIALPEEAFFRGYLQTALTDRYQSASNTSLRATALAMLVSSLVFALGHVVTSPDLSRLAVFFPSLLFGVLRAVSGGIGAAVFLHAICNIAAQLLSKGYDL